MTQELDSSRYARSIYSTSVRREVLWNVLEPGDPYDIKRSMIAKLPGDKKIFMGDHLQMVCLLQAAQIQRLCQFLEDYKLKFREVERSNLDRHSYEIQIKELTQKLEDQQILKADNAKLKEFIKRQGNQLEKNSRDTRQMDQNYKNLYEKSLEKISQMMIEGKNQNQTIEEYKIQLQNFVVRMEALEKAKNKQVQDLKLNYGQFSKESYEYNINAIKLQSQGELKKLQFEMRKWKQANDAKIIQIESLKRQKDTLSRQVMLTKGKGDNSTILQRTIVEYQNKLAIFSQQNERLSVSLRDIANKLDESQLRKRQMQIKIERFESQIRQKENRLQSSVNEINQLRQLKIRLQQQARKGGQIQQAVIQYETMMKQLKRQNEELASRLTVQLSSEKRMKEEIDRFSYQSSRFKIVQKQNVELKNMVVQNGNLKRKIAQLQNKINFIQQQIQRLTQLLRNKDLDLEKSRNITYENQSLKGKIRETEYTITSKYQSQLTRLRTDYQQKIEYLARTKGNQFQSKAAMYQQEMERLKQLLRSKTQQSEKQRVRINQLQTRLNRGQLESSVKIKNFESSYSQLKKQNEELYLKVRQIGDVERKFQDIQNRSQQLQRQIERLNQLIRVRENQLIGLKNKLREFEGNTQRFEVDANRKIVGYEQNINALKLQNQQLKRKIAQVVNEANKKWGDSSQQIERLNLLIRKTTDQRNQFDANIRQLVQQNQYLKQNLQKMVKDNEELRRKISENEAKLTNVFNQSSNNVRQLSVQNQNLKRQINDFKMSIGNFESETTRKINIYEVNTTNLSKQNQQLRRRLKQNENRLLITSQDLQKLNQRFKIRNEEFTVMQTNFRNFGVEYQNLKRYNKEFQLSMNNKLEGEVARKYQMYQQNIQNLSREKEEILRRTADLQSKLALLRQQYDRLTNKHNSIIQQTEYVKKIVSQKEIMISNLEVQSSKKIGNTENNLKNLARINEEQLRKINESDLLIRQKIDIIGQLQQNLRNLSIQNQNLKRQFKELQVSTNQKLEGQVSRRYANYEQTIAKFGQENQELRRKMQEQGNDFARRLNESQNKYLSLHQQCQKMGNSLNLTLPQNEALRKKLQNFESSISSYEGEVNRRVSIYQQNIAILTKENQQLRKKIQQIDILSRRLGETDNRAANIAQQLERTTANLKIVVQQNENLKKQLNDKHITVSNFEMDVSRKIGGYQQNLAFLQKQNEEVKKRLRQYQQKISLLNDQTNKLSVTIRNVSGQSEQYKRQLLELQSHVSNKYEVEVTKRYTTYEQNIAVLVKQGEQLRRRLQDAGELQRRYVELENKLILSNQQIQRLSINLRTKQEEFIKLEQWSRNEIDQSKRQQIQLQTKFGKTLDIQVRNNYNNYEQNIIVLKQKIVELQNNYKAACIDNEELNQTLGKAMAEMHHIQQITIEYNKLNGEFQNHKIKHQQKEGYFVNSITVIKAQNQNLVKKLQELEYQHNKLNIYKQGNEKIIVDYENKLMFMKSEIERLTQQFKLKGEQSQRMMKEIKNYQLQFKTNKGQYDSVLMRLNKENQQLRRKLQQTGDLNRTITQYQSKLTLIKQEVARLSQTLQIKNEEYSKLQLNYRNKIIQNQTMQRKMMEGSQLSRRIVQYQQKLSQFGQENDKLQFTLRNKTDELNNAEIKIRQLSSDCQNLKRQIQQSQKNLTSRFEMEISRKSEGFEQNIRTIIRQKQELARSKIDYESRIAFMSQQIQRLNSMYKTKSEQFQNLKKQSSQHLQTTQSEFTTIQTELKTRTLDYQSAKKHLQEYQSNIRKLYSQFERLQGIIDDLRKERQTLFDKNHALSEEINRLTAANKDLEEQTKDVRLRLADESALQKRMGEHLALMVVLFAEIQSLRQRVKDKQKEVETVRRSSLSPNFL